jgi:hypothetical protein
MEAGSLNIIIGLLVVVILGFGGVVYHVYFRKPKSDTTFKTFLKTPIDKKPFVMFGGDEGAAYKGFVMESDILRDNTANYKLSDGTKLYRIHDDHIRIMSSKKQVLSGDITALCCVDSNQNPHPWGVNETEQMSRITIARIKQETKNQLLNDFDYYSKLKSMPKMAGDADMEDTLEKIKDRGRLKFSKKDDGGL